jgi:autotransporter-associated beta strand protein
MHQTTPRLAAPQTRTSMKPARQPAQIISQIHALAPKARWLGILALATMLCGGHALATTYFSVGASGDPTQLTSWTNSAGANPGDFNSGDTFTVLSGCNFTIPSGVNWTVDASSSGTAATLQINSGGNITFTLSSTGSRIFIGGNLNQAAAGGVAGSGTTGTGIIEFTSNGTWTGSGDISTPKVSIQVDTGVTLDASGMSAGFKFKTSNTVGLTVNGTLITGTLTINGNGNSGAYFTLNSGGTLITATTSASGVPGIFTGFSAGKITLPAGANYTFNGTGAQVTGTTANNATMPTEVNNLTNNSAGLTLSQPMQVDGVLAFNAGVVTGNVTLNSGGTIAGGGSSAYLSGQLTVTFSAPTSAAFTFPIGTASAYSPISLANFTDTGAGTGTLTASATTGQNPNQLSSGISNTRYIGRYWTLTDNGGFISPTYDFTGTFVAGDIQNGANTANLVVREWNGSSWLSPTSSSSTSTTVTGTGFTSFGQYAAGENETLPVLVATTKTAITSTAATLGATINTDSGSSISDYGIVWGTAPNPTTAGNKVQAGTTVTPPNTFTVSATGLPVAATIYYRGYAVSANGTGYSTNDTFLTLTNAPATQASGVTGLALQNGNLTFSWVRGNGARCIVLVNAGSPVSSDPVDGTSYTANATLGSGSAVGSGYVVFLGTGTNVTITGLAAGTPYYVAVYELNGSGGSENYLTPPATGSQTTVTTPISFITWTGSQSSNWNNTNNWDALVLPDVGTPVVIPSSAANQPVYSNAMAAASIGSVTNNGILNINTNGFNCGTILMVRAGGGDQLFINNGGAANIAGNLGICSNAIASMAAGSSLTISGGLNIGSDLTGGTSGSSTVGCFGSFTNWGGSLTAAATALNPRNASIGTSCRLVIAGGTNSLGAVNIQRAPGTSSPPLGSDGLVISNGLVNMTSISLGNNAHGIIYLVNGVVTNNGTFTIQNTTSARPARFVQTGGVFVDANTVTMAGTADTVYAALGGTNSVAGFAFNGTTILFTNNTRMYVGSAGISGSSGSVSALLNPSGVFGASTDWSNSVSLTLNGGSFDCEDAGGTPHNIESSGVLKGSGALIKTGNGTLQLDAANTYGGTTTISAGTLALGAAGSVSSSLITVASGATFDVTQVSGGFTLGSGKTVAGVGTVVGLAAGSGSHISPAGTGAQGTLNFNNGLTLSGANLDMELTDDPSGLTKTNDSIKVTGDLNLSGITTIGVTPIGSLGIGTYKLISFTGNLNGSAGNFTCASGTVVANAGEIDLVVTSVRPSASLVWRGDGSANLWNTGGSSNWLNGASLDRFYTGDTNTFDDSATNFVVNISGTVTPASTSVVLVNSTNYYTFADGGSGDIHGTTGLVKTNTGTLEITVAGNDFTGVTAIKGGTLAVSTLANGGSPSPMGAASSASGNLVIDGGTLEYRGGAVSTDRGMTFGTNGASLSVTNAGATLTMSGSLTGSGTLTKTGNGQITLTGINNYSGGTVIVAGNVRGNPSSAIGTNTLTLNAAATSSATFQFSGDSQTLNNPLNILGTNNFISNGGNDTVEAIVGSGTVSLEGTTGNVLTFAGDMSSFSGTFYVDTLPNPRFNPDSGSIVGGTNVTMNLGTGSALLNNRNANLTVLFGSLLGGPSTIVQGGSTSSADNRMTTYVIGGNNASSEFDGVISESTAIRKVNLVKVGTGQFTLAGASTYTGSTTISNGVLALGNGVTDGAITGTTNLNLLAGAFLDLSGRSDQNLSLGSSQVLRGSGTIRGSLDNYGGGTIAPGDGLSGNVGTLTVTNNINLGATVWMKLNRAAAPNSDRLVSSLGAITYGGTLVVTNVGALLQVGDTFTLFSGGGLSAGAFTLVLPTYYTWDTSNLGVNGSISVTAAQPPPAITNVDFSALSTGTITLNAINGLPNGPVAVLTTTNLASGWTTLTTANFDPSGNLNLPITVDPTQPQLFIKLQGQ